MFDSRKYGVCSHGAVALQAVPLGSNIGNAISRNRSVIDGR